MIPIRIGQRVEDDEEIRLERDDFETHMHLIGATGVGKTSALHTILRSLMLDTGPAESAMFILDPMGNFSRELLNFIAHPTFCTQEVRDRLLYIQPSEEDFVLPFNPIQDTTSRNRYYKTMRAVDLVLRAWEAQDVTQQPRLLQWTYKTFCAAAQMNFPIALCQHLLHPGSEYHRLILDRLPPLLKSQWSEVLNARGGEAVKILESTRNRLDPFFQCNNLRHMFGVPQGRFDCERLIRERRIVIVNLASLGVIPNFICDTVGGLILNEIFETAFKMVTRYGQHTVAPTYVVLDEFQRYVSVDVQEALPTVRQMGLRLILSHQSFAQLERDDMALESMIWEARTRMIFANYAKDADLLADELAKINFDPMRVKEVRKTVRQLIEGYRKEWLEGYSESHSQQSQHGSSRGTNRGESSSRSFTADVIGYSSETQGSSAGGSESESSGSGSGYSQGSNRSQAMVPIHKTFEEITGVTYKSFEEQSLELGKMIRTFDRGEAMLQRPGKTPIEHINVNYLKIVSTPGLQDAVEELLMKNYNSEFFISEHEANREYEECLQSLLVERLDSIPPSSGLPKPAGQPEETDPFD